MCGSDSCAASADSRWNRRLVLGIAREGDGQPLQRDGAPARRVVRAVDLAHAAPADEVLKAVRPEFLRHVASLLFARWEDGTQASREPSRRIPWWQHCRPWRYSGCSPPTGPDGCAPRPRCVGWSPRPTCGPASSCCPCSSGRASTSRCPSRPCRASCSTPGRRCGRRPPRLSRGCRRAHALRRPRRPGRARDAGVDPDGVLNKAIRDVRAEVGDGPVVMSDVCLDEFTDHGHCGVLDATATSTTMPPWNLRPDGASPRPTPAPTGRAHRHDGRPGRRDPAGPRGGRAPDTAIVAYAAKYASAFYGPFREAVDSQLPGDRRPTRWTPPTAGRRSSRWTWTWPKAPTWSW